jgi:hypothetical protein
MRSKGGLLCDKVTQTEEAYDNRPVSRLDELSPERVGLVRNHLSLYPPRPIMLARRRLCRHGSSNRGYYDFLVVHSAQQRSKDRRHPLQPLICFALG